MVERRVIKYRTVIGDNSDALDEEVNKLLGEGWDLYGYPYATAHLPSQALVRYEKGSYRDGSRPPLT